MMKHTLTLLLLAMVVVTWTTVVHAQDQPESGTFRISPNRPVDTMSGGDQFPKDALWFNTDFPLSMQMFRNKGIMLVIWHPWSIDGVAQVQRMQEMSNRNPQVQLISIWPVSKDQEFSRSQLLDFIQLYGINHPVGIVSDLSSFTSLTGPALPQAMLYKMTATPELTGFGPSGLEKVLARAEEWLTDPAIMGVMYPWQVRGLADAMKYANPVIELPARISIGNGNDIIVSEPAHHRVIVVNGDGVGKTVFGMGHAGYTDGIGYTNRMQNPAGTALNTFTNEIYIADPGNHRVRVADPGNYLMYTLIGNGRYSVGTIDSVRGVLAPVGLPVDVEMVGRKLYVLSAGSNQLFECETAQGTGRAIADFPTDRSLANSRVVVTNLAAGAKGLYTVMSDGSVWYSQLKDSGGVKRWSTNEIYAPEGTMPRISAVCEFKGKVYAVMSRSNQVGTLDKGVVRVLAGSGERGWAEGTGTQAKFSGPSDIVVYSGRLLIADMGNHVLRLVNPKNGKTQTIGFQPEGVLLDLSEPLAVGDSHYTDSLMVSSGVNRISVQLDLDDWRLLPSGRNEVTAEVTGGIGIDSEELSGPSFSFSFYPDANDGYIQLEMNLTLRSVKIPELIIQKKILYSFEVKVYEDAPSTHELTFRPRLMPE